MKEEESLLEVENFALHSPIGEWLATLTFMLSKGEVVFLKGANGSGKSTFLRLLFNLLNKDSLSTYSGLKLSLVKEFSYLPQNLNREFFLPMTLQDVAHLRPDAKENPSELLESGLLTKPWNLASGGERQRALLAQVLAPDCQLYMLDEPFNHLDQKAMKELVKIIKETISSKKAAFIIATHVLPAELEDLSPVVKCVELK